MIHSKLNYVFMSYLRVVANNSYLKYISDFYFRYLYFLMFALFNAIYWTHVKMAAAASREVLAKNFGPVTDGD